MREARVIALAGVFQACALVRELATQGRADAAAVESSLASVFRIDSDSASDVFGGLEGIRRGLGSCLPISTVRSDAGVAQLAVGVLRLERRLRGAAPCSAASAKASRRSSARSTTSASATRPCRPVSPNSTPRRFRRSPRASSSTAIRCISAIRAGSNRSARCLAVRAAVLWRQVGGNQWRLPLRRREYAMVARGSLARSTLDRG